MATCEQRIVLDTAAFDRFVKLASATLEAARAAKVDPAIIIVLEAAIRETAVTAKVEPVD